MDTLKGLITLISVLVVAVPFRPAAAETVIRYEGSSAGPQWSARLAAPRGRPCGSYQGTCFTSPCPRGHKGPTVVTHRVSLPPVVKVKREVVYKTRCFGSNGVSICVTRPVVRYRTVAERRCLERTVVYDKTCVTRRLRITTDSDRRCDRNSRTCRISSRDGHKCRGDNKRIRITFTNRGGSKFIRRSARRQGPGRSRARFSFRR